MSECVCVCVCQLRSELQGGTRQGERTADIFLGGRLSEPEQIRLIKSLGDKHTQKQSDSDQEAAMLGRALQAFAFPTLWAF